MRSLTLYSGGSTVRHWIGISEVDIHEERIEFNCKGIRHTVTGTWIMEEN